jgi:uncharacterized cupin superfamily protein
VTTQDQIKRQVRVRRHQVVIYLDQHRGMARTCARFSTGEENGHGWRITTMHAVRSLCIQVENETGREYCEYATVDYNTHGLYIRSTATTTLYYATTCMEERS